jgi:hypothetical protein
MSYCALHLLNEIGHKPEERITNSPEIKTITTLMKRIKSGESGLEDEVLKLEQSLQNKFAERWAYKYMLVTDKADKLLTFTKNDESLAVQTSEFIHRNQMLSRKVKGGRDQFALIVNDAEILWPATEQPIQNWMEGVNKPGNKLIMNRYLFSDEPHAIQGILDQADSHIAFFVLNKKHPSYQEAKKKASEMQAKGIPLIVIEMDEPTMENTAGFSTFIEDFIVYYAGIIGQDPYTNPEVKYVRENSDSRLEVMADFKRDWLRLEAIPAAKKEEKSLKPKEVNPEDTALINFLSLFNQAGVALGIYPREVFSSLENNLDGELVVNAFAEANGVHRQTAIDGIKKAGVFSKVVVDYNEAMRKKEEVQKLKADKSAFIDEGTVKQKAKDIGITDIYFSLGPSDIPVDKAILGSLKKTYENIRGEDSLAKRIAEFIHLSAYVLKKDGVRRDNIVLTTNDQYRLGFAKAFKEFWGKNVSKLTKFILGIDMLPRASHLIIEGRLGQADSHFNIVVLAEELGLSKGHVLSREDVEFSNPAHQGLDRNEALFGLALGNEETILAKMPGIYIKVKEITPETDQMLAQLFKEVSEHYAKILTKVATSQTPEGEVKASLTEQASPFSSAELFTLENELGVVNVRESEPRKVTYYLTLGYQLSVKYMAEIDKSVIIFTSPFTLPNLSKAGLSLERKFDGDWYNSPFGNIMKELAEVVKEEENSASSAVRIFRGTGKRSFEIPLTYEYDQLITGRQILVVYKDKVEVARINLKTLQGYKIHNPVYSEMTERSYSADDGSFRIRINEDSMDFTSYVDGTFEVYVKSASSAVQADTVSHQSDSLVTESEFSSMLQAGDADFRFVNSLVMEFLKRRGNQEDTIGYIWDVNFSIGNLHFEKLRLRGKPGQEYTLNLINSSKHAININWYNNGVIVVQQTDKDMLTFMNRYGNAVTRIKEELEKVASSAVQAKDYAENSLEFAKFLEEILAGREDTVIDYDEAVDSFVMQGNRLKLDGGWQESINTNPASQITVSIQEGTKLMTVRKKSVSSPINRSGIDASFRSASIPDKGMGGIDFRALPMTIKPMGSFEGLNLRLPQLSSSALISFNLDEEVAQLNQMVSSGIIPSGSRVQELVAAAWQKGKLQDYQTEILTLLAEICKLQEGECCESSDEFKVALVAVNAV